MKLTFLGGANEIGASCMLFTVCDKNILLDSGIRQKSNQDVLPDFRTIQDMGGVDAIIVSHAHMDHIGSLPIISKEYPNARIYMNNMTKDLVKVLLKDSLKIMNNRESEIPFYVENDVEDMLNRVFTLNYQTEFEIFEGMKLTFYNAGHIAGASCSYITTVEGSLFYSGDFSVFTQKTVEGAKIPRLRPDIAIFESTYGDKLHSNREREEQRLVELVNECTLKGGKMLIPSFALGRAQEIILILKKAMNNGKLRKTKIYIDGMIKDINRTYKLNPLYLKSTLGKKILRGVEPFYDDNISIVESKEEREKLVNTKESFVIISSSGMLSGGPSQYYAEKIATLEEGYIVITGYQDEEAPGRKLLELMDTDEKERTLEINNKNIPVKCKVERVGLSAHGDKSEIKALVNLLSPKNIFLVHGEASIIQKLALEISAEKNGRVYVPQCGETVDVEVYNPRKQFKRELQFFMNEKSEITEDNIENLWKFINENYGDKFITIEEILTIWTGKKSFEKSAIEKLQGIIVKSLYFENDLRRFFMFKAKSVAEVEEELRPKELKQNELEVLIKEQFEKYAYKKSGFILNEKKVILYFDFPKTIDSKIYEEIQLFCEKYSWKVEINEQTNTNALENVLRVLLKNASIKKISFLLNEGKIMAVLNNGEGDFVSEKLQFKKQTGLDLLFQIDQNKAVSFDEKKFNVEDCKEQMEQNAALAYIDSCFKEEEFKPYKKGIKTNSTGKYIELSFISPEIGKKFNDKLELIVNDIGWSVAISNSVNQNEIIGLASSLCIGAGFTLKKNPSFNPGNLKVVVKIDNFDEEKFLKIKNEFDFKTGCFLSE